LRYYIYYFSHKIANPFWTKTLDTREAGRRGEEKRQVSFVFTSVPYATCGKQRITPRITPGAAAEQRSPNVTLVWGEERRGNKRNENERRGVERRGVKKAFLSCPWLSKVLLIKIKFIACLLIKMKTDATDNPDLPNTLSLLC